AGRSSYVWRHRQNGGGTVAPTRVLVTGAAGFIGSHLVEALLRSGHRVVGADRRPPAGPVPPDLEVALLDLTTGDLTGAVGGCATVFPLAAIPGVRGSWGERFGAYVSANVIGTARLLQACERADVRRLVYASSSSVYGSADRPSRESDPTSPMSPYGVTKLA